MSVLNDFLFRKLKVLGYSGQNEGEQSAADSGIPETSLSLNRFRGNAGPELSYDYTGRLAFAGHSTLDDSLSGAAANPFISISDLYFLGKLNSAIDSIQLASARETEFLASKIMKMQV